MIIIIDSIKSKNIVEIIQLSKNSYLFARNVRGKSSYGKTYKGWQMAKYLSVENATIVRTDAYEDLLKLNDLEQFEYL